MSLFGKFALTLVLLLGFACEQRQKNPTSGQPEEKQKLAVALETHARREILDKWYPQAVDSIDGGFLSTFTVDFKPSGDQDKMIVSQSRHIWTNSKAAEIYPEVKHYLTSAKHGFLFLRDHMWDQQYGGFHWLVDKKGNPKASGQGEKTAYGNAFGIYGLSAYYKASKDTAALSLAKKAFVWLEEHSHDSVNKGYFQHLRRDGTAIVRDENVMSTAQTGYKDQNSSIHLLEAFTELYTVWPDPLVRERLHEMLLLIRDTITTPKGYLTLFLTTDWKPVSFQDYPDSIIQRHRGLDHVSFGHDVETAYLMLESSHILGLENDSVTMKVAKRMVDHALRNGWDDNAGGFYDEAYYFKNKPGITVTHDTKNWWAQAEGLNTLLLMADHFPNDENEYYSKFLKLWQYCDTYLIDHEHGDWFEGGLDKQPDKKTALKGHIWKATYHQYRSMINCVERLRRTNSEL
ncbi:MAG: AGE family epimerase/isomerase [Chryseolinea sp.]